MDGRPVRQNVEELPSSPVSIRLALLSGFVLLHDGCQKQLPLSAQRLVAFLALRDRPVLRDHVAGSLWLDAPADRANANLRSALWRVRTACRPLIQTTRVTLQVAPDVVLDIRQLVEMADRLADPVGTFGEVDLAGIAFGGDLLPDWYDEWVIMERERLRQVRLHALESLCDRLVSAKRGADAVQAGLAAVAAEPLRESAHRALIRAHVAEGNAGEALRQYALYERLVRKELGLHPSPLMESLISGLRRS
ncbi:MAG TPA: BTAD domain-containing putative transcriptional regulator [Actinomycetota bacterium]|nr:BTAD domain-containing putative transcriptional regulator [Actinomycetota bacterium]